MRITAHNRRFCLHKYTHNSQIATDAPRVPPAPFLPLSSFIMAQTGRSKKYLRVKFPRPLEAALLLCYNIFCMTTRMPVPPENRQSGDKEVKTMKEKIHPNYGKAIVRCVCGETFETGSVKKEMRVDICSKCHPFYTGKQKLVDSGGRVDRFKKRYGM